MRKPIYWAASLLVALSCSVTPLPEDPAGTDTPQEQTDPETPVTPAPKSLIINAWVDGVETPASGTLAGVSLQPVIGLGFSREIKADEASLSAVTFSGGEMSARMDPANATVLLLTPVSALQPFTDYTLSVAEGECFGVNLKKAFSLTFTTGADTGDKFPRISDEELLDLVQEKTFAYFWDYAHGISGLARERYGSGDTVTSGGSGFGIMCIPVAIERGFITREEGAERMRLIIDFLTNKAQRFHGAFSHWLNGSTGEAIAFSTNDNGADLVETAFLMEGLLTAAMYFNTDSEADIRSGIDALWRAVEWDWFTQGGQNVLYWHWSPDKGWAMNMPIRGWNEGLIVYVLGASSPTHPISKQVYTSGWAGSMSASLPVNGPMFFAHYSFLGLDPRGLKDAYADYWSHNVAHARYNYDYCVQNPGRHAGYSADCWGLTASDYPGGYTASAPSHDTGTIAPTAALASMPYLPEESLAALHTFYYIYGDKLFGKYGFRDAFNLDQSWFATSYIAIDQGPIVVMIENFRTSLLWDCFMQHPDVLAGLSALGFTHPRNPSKLFSAPRGA